MNKSVRRAAIIAASAALAASGTIGAAVASQASPARGARTLRYYAFDINNGTTRPGLHPGSGHETGSLRPG